MGVSIKNLRRTFRSKSGASVAAVDGITLELEDGEFLVILGPSGSGKTTLLRCIAGLEQADEGEITINGREIYSSTKKIWMPPEKRGLSMVFQSYALWPHMTVFDNVAYPLRVQRPRLSQSEIASKVERVLEMVGCEHLIKRYPGQLSGGQQQRVAVARAIVAGSDVVLFDEPLSSIDARVREDLRKELVALQAELGFTAIYITHDQTEATVMGNRVAVLADGKLQQLAPPRELYDRPNSAFVAQFIGAANQFAGTVTSTTGGTVSIQSEVGVIRGRDAGFAAGEKVLAIVRPESFMLHAQRPLDKQLNVWPCTVERSLFLGLCTEYLVRIGDVQVSVKSMDSGLADGSSQGWLAVAPERVHVVKS